MFKGIFGRKIGMTQIYNETGTVVPVTVIQADPCVVVRTKRSDGPDGYDAIVVGFGEVDKPTKPHAGQFSKKSGGVKRHLREFRLPEAPDCEVGSEITVATFEVGDRVAASGTSKGKGFAGTVKRHGFSRGPMSHGSKSHRRPASTGGTDAARVFKGVRKPGRMGNERVTVKGLRIVRIDEERNLLLVSGSVPGSNGSIVEVCAQVEEDDF